MQTSVSHHAERRTVAKAAGALVKVTKGLSQVRWQPPRLRDRALTPEGATSLNQHAPQTNKRPALEGNVPFSAPGLVSVPRLPSPTWVSGFAGPLLPDDPRPRPRSLRPTRDLTAQGSMRQKPRRTSVRASRSDVHSYKLINSIQFHGPALAVGTAEA